MIYKVMTNHFQNVSYKKHFHSTYSISLILDGECDILIDSKRYGVSKGEIRVINPFELHEITKSSWTHKNLVLDMDFVSKVLGQKVVFKNVIKDKKLAYFLQKREMSLSDTEEFLKLLDKNYSLKDSVLKEPNSSKLQKALCYIKKNVNTQELNVEKVAKYVGFSKYHFIREFKKEMGVTPYQYIHNLKINNAKELLLSSKSASLVAFQCGFADQSHFIKIYKKFYGHTPSKVSNNLLS